MYKPIMSRDENVQARFVKHPQAMKRYSMCRNSIDKIAREAGALIKIGRSVFIDIEKLDDYMIEFANKKDYDASTEPSTAKR